MNWIIKFNQLEKESIDKILDIIANFDTYKNDLLDNIYTVEYESKHIINNIIEKLNANKITQEYFDTEIQKITQISKAISDEYQEVFPKINEQIQNCFIEIEEIKSSMINKISEFFTNSKEVLLMKKRMDLLSRKINNMILVFDIGNLDEMDMISENYEDLMMIEEIATRKNNEYDDRQYELMQKLKEDQKKDYQKIFDYKEMIALAEKNEYTKVRQTGDHIIMQHLKTNKIVPIPAHELKYGLMLQIQKQIKANKMS